MPADRSHYEAVLADLLERRRNLEIAIDALRQQMPPRPANTDTAIPAAAPIAPPPDDHGTDEEEDFDEGTEGMAKDGRSRKEKKRQVLEILSDPTLRERTDVEIAKLCRVSRPFVAKIRRELLTQGHAKEF